MARFRVLARLAQAATSAIAVAALVGWQLDEPRLKSVVPGLIAMNPLTALCFLLSAFSLALGTATRHVLLQLAQRIAAALVASSGLVCLCAYACSRPPIIDQWIFAARMEAASVPSHMAPNTAFNFLCIGTAALLLAGRRVQDVRMAQVLAGIAMLTASVALTGYVYGVTALTHVAAFIPMALHSAVGFQLVAVAALFAVPDRGPIARVVSIGPGGRLVRRLVPAFLVLPPLLGWLRVEGQRLGLYDSAFGAAIMVGATSLMGMVLVWLNADALDRTDAARLRIEEVTHQLAYFDALTGLPNRSNFADCLQHAIARSRRYGGLVAVMFLDLDGFKRINDTEGHAGGDALLKSVALRLRSCTRPTDTPARLAGDEFTIVLTDLVQRSAADLVARRVLEELARPFEIHGRSVSISASIGISIFPRDGDDVTTLMHQADLAMYRAKAAGKNRVEHAPDPADAPVTSVRGFTASSTS